MKVADFKNMIWDYSRKINENSNKAFSPFCEKYGLTLLQVRILMEIHQYDSHTIGSLAEGINVAGANISAMCKKLENMGLLERVRDKNDERVVKVALNEKGRNLVLEIDETLNKIISEQMDDKIEETFDDIIRGLKKFNDLLLKIISVNKKRTNM